MMITPFTFGTTPQLYFGTGKFSVLPSAIRTFGTKALVVTGARSFMRTHHGQNLLQQLNDQGVQAKQYSIPKEPTPTIIDEAVQEFRSLNAHCVVAIGGGSALDAGKAISAMLPLMEGVKDYLEGVGTKTHPGSKFPFIAIPTTSGTGSEATKNSVISETGEAGYKRSLRHNNFVPNIAIVDPLLTSGCTPETTASSGMDAFTQLLESYLSTTASPITDSLALEGLQRVARSLLNVYRDGNDIEARSDMSLAAYLSGITLANAGLGLVHGFASSIGGYFDIPHGVICSTLMEGANRMSVKKLRTEKSNAEALKKYAEVGRMFTNTNDRTEGYYTDLLLDTIGSLSTVMKTPRLSDFGVTLRDVEKIIRATDNKNNPVPLNKEEMSEVLRNCL